MTTFDNMENQDASEKNNDRNRPDRMVESKKQTPGEKLARKRIAPHEAQRARNPIRPRLSRRVDARERKKIDRRGEAALKIISTMLGV